MAKYIAWLDGDGSNEFTKNWLQPDLADWRDALIAQGKAPATVSAYLSSVRGAYTRVIDDPHFRDLLYEQARLSGAKSPADQKAFVDELVTRIENAASPKSSPVKATTYQDKPDAMHLRLSRGQAEALINAPGVATMKGLRDTAIIAVLLCTGIREAELVALNTDDLRQELGGELALYVQKGKGNKARLVPYGELEWCLIIVDRWSELVGIDHGPVFRGLYKGGGKLRPGRLSVRAVEDILASYPVAVDGHMVKVRPHDCRRTYARRLYEAGADIVAIQQNLGHASIETTLGYIGELDASRRRAPAVYTFDLAKLEETPMRLV
jgi:integrase